MPDSISFVIPVHNEAPSLPELVKEVIAVCMKESWGYEIIFVDDGSDDESWSTIQQVKSADPNIRGIRLRKNFGKSAALEAGFKVSRFPLIATLDGDLQDVPTELPKLWKRMHSDGLDLVVGWKEHRADHWSKVFPSRVFNRMIDWLTGPSLHDHNSGFKLLKRELLSCFILTGDLHRFMTVFAFSAGYRVGEVPVEHRPRKYGHSNYGMGRFFKGFIDLLTIAYATRFGQKPQHFFGGIGLGLLLVGCFFWFLSFFNNWTSFPRWSYWVSWLANSGVWLGFCSIVLGIILGGHFALPSHAGMDYSIAETTDEPPSIS